MTQSAPTPPAFDRRELSHAEIECVSGGMKWQRGTSNPDVIDARGGSFVIFGFIVTLDVNGDISSVRPK